jgi:GNAT superfamily N-acetyltransferase
MLTEWVARARERAGGYSLVPFDGVCPPEHLEAFAAVVPVMNTAPGAHVDHQAPPSPEYVRDNMAAHVRQGNDSWTVCARDDATGRFVGYTELSISHHRPWWARQGDTGVDAEHRRRGIGRWLKAHNALRLLRERPDVEYIETWNAVGNTPMLAINRTMGFAPVALWQQWELPVSAGSEP